jgi:hypothetical protein
MGRRGDIRVDFVLFFLTCVEALFLLIVMSSLCLYLIMLLCFLGEYCTNALCMYSSLFLLPATCAN